MKFIYEKTLLILLLNSIVNSQSYIAPGFTDEIRNVINDKLSQQLDENIKVVFVLNVDSTLGDGLSPYYPEIGEIKNPYNTLTNCLVFTAINKIENKGLVGVFKDDNIIWHNNLEISPLNIVYPLNIPIIIDINNDGVVDILTTWVSGVNNNPLTTLWIYSWDGIQGFKINNTDGLGQSSIKSDSYNSFDLLDIEGDGIWEIIGYEKSYKNLDSLDFEDLFNYFPIVYQWDNNFYTKQSLLIDLYNDIFPRDRINEKVKARIIEINNIISYNYTINNLESSYQNINEISFLKLSEDIDYILPKFWSFAKYDSLFYFWNDGILGINHIDKNSSEEITIITKNSKLPAISKYYIRGWNGDFNNHFSDLNHNSKIGFTIMPADFLDTMNVFSFIDSLLSFNNQSYNFNWIIDNLTADKYDSLFSLAKAQLQQNNNNAAKATLQTVLQQVDIDSTNNLTSEAYALLRYNTEYLLEKIPQSSPNLIVNLKSSTGTLLTTGSLQYYEGSWKDAVNNGDGTFTVITSQNNVSLRMTYEYAQQTVNNIPAHKNTYTFQTVSANVQLKNSLGTLIDTGTVQYYAGAWRSFGTTSNGVATKELLPINYSFRMTYEFASIDKQQNLSVDPIVVFQTANAQVQLKNSLGNLIDQGTVQYYSGAWRSFGTTSNGVATKELLPINYSFRMTYEFASIDKQQNLATDPTVIFQTVNAQVQLKNSLGNLIDQGTVQYYSGAWRSFGTTSNGVAAKELLPINYSFRMTYEFASIDKQQNLSVDPIVVFQTVNAQVQLKNSLGNLIDQGTVQYYSGAWRSFGTTSNGVAAKELLPINYSFRMTYEFASIDKQQNLSVDPTVVFQTVNAAVQLKNSLGNLIDVGTVQYYAGAWRNFGTTTNGVAYKELLPINYSFRMTYEYGSQDKQQNLSADPTVVFQTVNAAVQLKNSLGNLIDAGTVQYYAGAWRSFGTTTNGVVYKELLPLNYSFRMTYEFVSKDKQQNLSTNPVVDFSTVLCSVKVSKTSDNQPINNATVKYYAGAWRNLGTTNSDGITTKELLPANLSFRASYGNVSVDKQQDISVNSLVEILLNIP